jgi:hypothetical protein
MRFWLCEMHSSGCAHILGGWCRWYRPIHSWDFAVSRSVSGKGVQFRSSDGSVGAEWNVGVVKRKKFLGVMILCIIVRFRDPVESAGTVFEGRFGTGIGEGKGLDGRDDLCRHGEGGKRARFNLVAGEEAEEVVGPLDITSRSKGYAADGPGLHSIIRGSRIGVNLGVPPKRDTAMLVVVNAYPCDYSLGGKSQGYITSWWETIQPHHTKNGNVHYHNSGELLEREGEDHSPDALLNCADPALNFGDVFPGGTGVKCNPMQQ